MSAARRTLWVAMLGMVAVCGLLAFLLADQDSMRTIEMEGAAMCGTAERLGVPWLVVRALSDRAGEDSLDDFKTFLDSAAASSAALVRDLLLAFD